MKIRHILFYIFLTLSVATYTWILVESGVNGSNCANESLGLVNSFIAWVKTFAPDSPIVQDPETTHTVIRKLVGHFLFFGLAGIFTSLTFVFLDDGLSKRKIESIILMASVGFIMALASELIQLVTPGRFFMFTDVLIDFSGFVLFAGFVYLISFLVFKRQEKKK